MSAKWWALMMTSLMPKVRRRMRVISRRVRPESSTRALGRLPVSGRRRVPKPAAKIMAFMGTTSSKTLKPKRDSLHPRAGPFGGAKGKEKVGQLRSEWQWGVGGSRRALRHPDRVGVNSRRTLQPQSTPFERCRGLSLERFPLAQFLQLEMAHGDFQAVLVAQALGQLLG